LGATLYLGELIIGPEFVIGQSLEGAGFTGKVLAPKKKGSSGLFAKTTFLYFREDCIFL
jgi:hypothetical protein